jgi:glutathione-regulated potassium-efflux system ancillary protein KefC
MATTPLLLMAHDRWLVADEAPARPADAIEPDHAPVLLAGFGRYGQIVARLLLATGIRPTVIDHDADTIDSARRAGFVVHFGDATEADLLTAAGAGQARVMVVAIDDPQQASRVVALVREHWPQLRIVARARDAVHAMDLMEDGVHHVQRELFESSLRSGRAVLEALDFEPFHARTLADDFRRYSEGFLRTARADRHNQDDLIRRVREAREQFERQMQADLARQQTRPGDGGWQRDDSPTP